MNIKVVLAFLAGAVCALATVAIVGLVVPQARALAGTYSSDEQSPADTNGITGLVAVLQKVRSEIRDPDTGRYFDRLVRAYELPCDPGVLTGRDAAEDGWLLPDIKNVQVVAIMLPLQEAGKNIRDPEIAEFYWKFLSSAGLSGPVTGGKQ